MSSRESLTSKIRLLLYFDISNSIVNQTISVPVGVDDDYDKRIIDYDTSNHLYLCRYCNLDEVICDYLQYKIYEVIYTIIFSHIRNENTDVHHQNRAVPTLSINLYHNIFTPLPRYAVAIKNEMFRLYHPTTAGTNDFIIAMEEYILLDIISHMKLAMNPHRICIIHSAVIVEGQVYIIDDIMKHIIDSDLITALDMLIILNYGHDLLDSNIQRYISSFPSILYYHVSHDVSYFEAPTIRILHKLSQYIHDKHTTMNHNHATDNHACNRLILEDDSRCGYEHGMDNSSNQSTIWYHDTHILYLHTKGASYQHIHPNIELWRSTMLQYLVDKYMKAYHLLQSGVIDTVGIFFVNVAPQHYMGNYWWSKISYLSKLPSLDYDNCGKYEPSYWLFSYHNNNNSISISAFNLHTTTDEYHAIFDHNVHYHPLHLGITYSHYE